MVVAARIAACHSLIELDDAEGTLSAISMISLTVSRRGRDYGHLERDAVAVRSLAKAGGVGFTARRFGVAALTRRSDYRDTIRPESDMIGGDLVSLGPPHAVRG